MQGLRTAKHRTLVAAVIAATVLLASGCGPSQAEESADPASSPVATRSPNESDPATSERGAHTAYNWVDGTTTADTYSVVFVRRISPREALSVLGDVRRDAGSLTSEQALNLESDLTDPDTYAAPPIVQIGRLDGGVVIYSPYGFRPVERLRALSRKGVAATFTTTVELDTSIAVARNGQQTREFDPFFHDEEERQGALPQEHDVDFSDDEGFPAAWTFLDQVTRHHVARGWFLNSTHPTYVLTDRG